MNTKLVSLIKSILYPVLLLLAHGLAENWTALVALLGPKYAWLAGPTVVMIGGAILHQLQSPNVTNGGKNLLPPMALICALWAGFIASVVLLGGAV